MDHPPEDGRGGYRVGYKRPPLHSRFAKGKSGNPSGRKRAQGFGALLQKALAARVTVTADGTPRRITKREAVIVQLVNRAAEADPRAVKLLFELSRQVEGPESLAITPLAEDPRQVLLRKLEQLAGENVEGADTALAEMMQEDDEDAS